jgi:flagellar protein FliS
MLYEAAIEAIRNARGQLASGDIRGRSESITRAVEILAELGTSLDHGRGGELSERLAALYDYVQRRLLAANFEQSDAPLAESASLLETLLNAWKQIQAPAPVTAEAPAWAAAAGAAQQSGHRLNLTL